ncbi:MAG: RNA polymerase sigma factor [Candidatus Aminicenantes bacterium]|nr:MAG: RNA polymerase sigma factor [Candidatus Aminicenantes bacterium]
MAKQLSDKELVSEVAAGSQTSFEELVARYSPRLFHFLRHKVSTDEDIEDLIQETFLKAFRNIGRYNPDFKFSTWLYTIAVRLAISSYRSNKTKDMTFVPVSSSPEPPEIVIQKEESQNIWILARALKKDQYEALWLRYAEDLSVKEIAKVMKKTQVYVRVLLHRARLNLAKEFSQSVFSEKSPGTEPLKHKFSFL